MAMEAQEQHHEADASHAPAEVRWVTGLVEGEGFPEGEGPQHTSAAVLACQVLPLNRIKRLMKEETDVKAVSAEASYAAARATVRMP